MTRRQHRTLINAPVSIELDAEQSTGDVIVYDDGAKHYYVFHFTGVAVYPVQDVTIAGMLRSLFARTFVKAKDE